MNDPAVRLESDRSRRPDLATAGQRAQERSSKAAGLRVSGPCLTGPSTLAFSVTPRARPKTLSATTAVCPSYWGQNNPYCSVVIAGTGEWGTGILLKAQAKPGHRRPCGGRRRPAPALPPKILPRTCESVQPSFEGGMSMQKGFLVA